MAFRRRVAVLCFAFALLPALLASRPALAATGAPPPPASMSCAGQVVVGVPTSATTNSENIDSSANVQCAVPIVTGSSPPGVGRDTGSIPNGTACQLVSWQPVTLRTVGFDTRTGMSMDQASWPEPPGANGQNSEDGFGLPPASGGPVPWQPPSGEQVPVSESPLYQAMYDLQVKYTAPGHYINNVCVMTPGQKYTECTVPNVIYRGSSLSASACTRPIFRGAVAPSLPPGYGLQNFNWTQYVQNHVVAGAINSAPKPDQGLVNILTYYWINGMSIDGYPIDGIQSPPPRTSVMRIATPPDGNGRSIVYQYVVQVGLDHIDWSFGDGSHASPALPQGVGQPYPAQSTVNHPYTTISVKGCQQGACGGAAGDRYHVTANAVYQVSVTAVWFDGVASTSQPIALPNNGQFPIPVTAADLYVGQAEGVPVGS